MPKTPSPPSPAMTARRSPAPSTNSTTARPPPAWRSPKATMPSCSTQQSPTAWCGGRKRTTCACTSTARSKRACNRSIASCWAASTKAPGRPKPAATPGCRARCAAISGSIRPSAASDLPRTTSRKRLGAAEVILSRAAKLAGAPTVTSRFVQRIAALAGPRWDEVLARGNTYLDLARALDSPAAVKAAERPAPKPKARGAAAPAVGHRHRGLAARPLHDLRQIYSPPAAARCRRHAAGRARPRHRHPCGHRRLHPTVRGQAAGRPDAGTARARRQALCAARRFSGGARVLVAAFSAHRAMVRTMGQRAARRHCVIACGNPRRAEIPRRQARIHAVRHRRPHRAAQGRQLRHHRLQDRRGPHREAGAHGAGAAIDAGSRHFARRRLQEVLRRLGVAKSPT